MALAGQAFEIAADENGFLAAQAQQFEAQAAEIDGIEPLAG